GSFPGIQSQLVTPATGTAAPVANDYLVGPNPATDSPAGAAALGRDDVDAIVQAALAKAKEIRAAIRLPNQSRTATVIAASDPTGNWMPLSRIPDAPVFSIDVAVGKSRNLIYFSSPSIVPEDALDEPFRDKPSLGQAFPPGTAITNRTLSFGAQPLFP